MERINVRVLTRPIDLPETDGTVVRMTTILQDVFDNFCKDNKNIRMSDICENAIVCERLSEILTKELGVAIKVHSIYQNYDMLRFEYSISVCVIMDLPTDRALKDKNDFMDLFDEVMNDGS